MSVSITQKKKVQETIVDHAKIVQMNIDVQNKKIVFTIAFGTFNEKGLTIVDKKMVTVTATDFDTLVATKGDPSKSLYDHIAEISYNYLKSKNLLTYEFRR